MPATLADTINDVLYAAPADRGFPEPRPGECTWCGVADQDVTTLTHDSGADTLPGHVECGEHEGYRSAAPAADDRLTTLAALAAALGLVAAWTLPGQAARWTGPGVELVADDPDRGSGVHVVPADDAAPVRTFDADADPADIADAIRAAGPHHTAYSEPHPTRGTWTSPPTCHPNRAAADARVDAVTALAGPGAASRRTWTVRPCDGTCR